MGQTITVGGNMVYRKAGRCPVCGCERVGDKRDKIIVGWSCSHVSRCTLVQRNKTKWGEREIGRALPRMKRRGRRPEGGER